MEVIYIRKNIKNVIKNKSSIFLIFIAFLILLSVRINPSFASNEDWAKFDTWETKANTNNYGFGSKSVAVGDKIYIFGGYAMGESTARFEIYDSNLDKWTVQPDMPYDTRFQGCEEINGNIYVFGGQKTEEPVTDEMYCYNIESNTWSVKAPMLEAKRSFAHCVIDGKIYVAGGYGENDFLSDLDCYNPETDEWTRLASMANKRSSLCGISSNGKFYVFGGWKNGTTADRYITEVEVYNPIKNSWETKSNMSMGKISIIAQEYNGYIFIVGGNSAETNSIDTLECYSTYTDKWITLSPMPTARYNYAMSKVGDKLYVINGSVGGTAYKTTEAYNIPNEAYLSFLFANKYKTIKDIEIARYEINKLENGSAKTELQSLLNDIIPVDMPTISKEQTTSMLDLYIKPVNYLNVSLDTNYICFEDFNGVNDIEKNNAINITVNSTLPYSVKVSIPTNIVDEESTSMIDKNILSIKESSSDTYQTFDNSIEYLTLLDNQSSGGANNHSIDIKLNAKVLPTTSIYKTVLKFKIEQK